jgi:hypothetical protein
MLENVNLNDLKEILKLNNQPRSGVKDELLDRVVEGMVSPSLPFPSYSPSPHLPLFVFAD